MTEVLLKANNYIHMNPLNSGRVRALILFVYRFALEEDFDMVEASINELKTIV